MQTTSTNDSMMSDFFQVGGYTNLAGVSAGLISGRGLKSDEGQKLSDLASKGRLKGFLGKIHLKFTRIYDEIKQDFELDDFRINQLYAQHKMQGGNINNFKDYVSQAEESKVKEQIVNEENTLPNMDSIDVSDVDFTEKKSGVPMLYVGLGAVALVGITIIIVRKF